MSKEYLDGVLKTEYHTIKKTIGGVGVAGCDFNFATALNQNEQPIDLGAVIPAMAKVIDVSVRTNSQFTGAITLVADIGFSSGSAELCASATFFDADAILSQATALVQVQKLAVAARHIWLNATPGANWNLVTAGKCTVYITYQLFTNV